MVPRFGASIVQVRILWIVGFACGLSCGVMGGAIIGDRVPSDDAMVRAIGAVAAGLVVMILAGLPWFVIAELLVMLQSITRNVARLAAAESAHSDPTSPAEAEALAMLARKH